VYGGNFPFPGEKRTARKKTRTDAMSSRRGGGGGGGGGGGSGGGFLAPPGAANDNSRAASNEGDETRNNSKSSERLQVKKTQLAFIYLEPFRSLDDIFIIYFKLNK